MYQLSGIIAPVLSYKYLWLVFIPVLVVKTSTLSYPDQYSRLVFNSCISSHDWYLLSYLKSGLVFHSCITRLDWYPYPISGQDWYFITVSAVMSATSYPILTISWPVFHSRISCHDWYLLSYPFSIHDRYLFLYQLSWWVHPILSHQYHDWNFTSVSILMTGTSNPILWVFKNGNSCLYQ